MYCEYVLSVEFFVCLLFFSRNRGSKEVVKFFLLVNHVLPKDNQPNASLFTVLELNNIETIVTSSSKHSQHDVSHITLLNASKYN